MIDASRERRRTLHQLERNQPLIDRLVDGPMATSAQFQLPFEVQFESVSDAVGAGHAAWLDPPPRLAAIPPRENAAAAAAAPAAPHSDAVRISCFSLAKQARGPREYVMRGDDGAEQQATSMQTYRQERSLLVQRPRLAGSGFLQAKVAPGAPWENSDEIRLRVARNASVAAVVAALELLVSEADVADALPTRRAPLLELLNMAHALQIPSVVDACMMRVLRDLDLGSVVMTVDVALACAMDGLVARCYGFLVRAAVETGQLPSIIWEAARRTVLPPPLYRRVKLVQGSHTVPLDALVGARRSFLRRVRGLDRPVGAKRLFVGRVHRMDSEYVLSVIDEAGGLSRVLRGVLDAETEEYLMTNDFDVPVVEAHNLGVAGAVRSNLTGTFFSVYNYGTQLALPRSELFPAKQRRELAIVRYKRNILGSVPRSFTVVLRRLAERKEEEGVEEEEEEEEKKRREVVEEEAEDEEEEGEDEDVDGTESVSVNPFSKLLKLTSSPIEADIKAKRLGRLVELQNKEPEWSEALQAYTLDFGDHVRLPSKKNFQLHAVGDPHRDVQLMFGKVSPTEFYIHFKGSISPVVAFGVVLSSFDRKRFVT